jgi:hypothetical protein
MARSLLLPVAALLLLAVAVSAYEGVEPVNTLVVEEPPMDSPFPEEEPPVYGDVPTPVYEEPKPVYEEPKPEGEYPEGENPDPIMYTTSTPPTKSYPSWSSYKSGYSTKYTSTYSPYGYGDVSV